MAQLRAPSGYLNWLAFARDEPHLATYEFALYSDAPITAELRALGPYDILNTIGMRRPPRVGFANFALVLRAAVHRKEEPALVGEPKPDPGSHHAGWTQDEIAALLSLALGVRCVCGGLTRMFGPDEKDPLGSPFQFDHVEPVLVPPTPRRGAQLPRIDAEKSLADGEDLLRGYANLPTEHVLALVRAARGYQRALWIADFDPSLAWIEFVGAIETAAATWKLTATDPVELIAEYWPELNEILEEAPKIRQDVAGELAPLVRSQRKFRDFLLAFAPPAPNERGPTFGQVDWDKLDRAMATIYRHRSKDLHEGLPFPVPMCTPPMNDDTGLWEAPGGTWGSGDAVWTAEDAPMHLHTFEYIVRRTLQAWWKSLAGPSNPRVSAP